MRSQQFTRGQTAWILALAGILALIVSLSSCGKDKATSREVAAGTNWRPTSATSVGTPRGGTPATPDEAVSTNDATGHAADGQAEASVREPQREREVTYTEAESAYRERRYADALKLFGVYTDRHEENPWGFYMLGLSAWKAGDAPRAEEALKRALELDPDHVKSELNLSRVLLDTGRPWDAMLCLDRVLSIEPTSSVAYRLKGRAYDQMGQPIDAVEAYRNAIRLDDEDAWSMNNLGLVFIQVGRFSDALPPLARAVELKGDIAIFQNNLGIALERTGHFRAAEEAYRSALAVEGSKENALMNIARVEVLVEDPTIASVDLAALSRDFSEEASGWRVAGLTGELQAVSDGGDVALPSTPDTTVQAIDAPGTR